MNRVTTQCLPVLLLLSIVGCCGLLEDDAPPQPTDTPAPTSEPATTIVDSPPLTPSAPFGAPSGDYTAQPDRKLARNFYVIFDGSGSMRDRRCAGNYRRKLAAAQWAFTEFLPSVEAEANLGVLSFDKKGLREVVPLGPDNRDSIKNAVDGVVAGGGTPLGPSIRLAVQSLQEQREIQLGYGEYHLVVVTDGKADSRVQLRKAMERANDAGVLVHTIGFCVSADNELRSASYSYRSASDPEELRAAVLSVLAESEDFQPMEFEQLN